MLRRSMTLALVAAALAVGGCKGEKAGEPAAGSGSGSSGARPTTPAELAQTFDRACVTGDHEACRNLGVMYAEGQGVVANPARSAALYGQACERGNAKACDNLGLVLLQGHGVPAAPARARELFKKACDGGNALGCRNLGLALVGGTGGPREPEAARALFEQACAKERRGGLHQPGPVARQRRRWSARRSEGDRPLSARL